MLIFKLYLLYPIVSNEKIQKRANKCWYITILDFVSIVTTFKKKIKKYFYFIEKKVYIGYKCN